MSQVKTKIEHSFIPMQMWSSWFAWCIFKLCRWPFTQDYVPDTGCLIMHCRHSGFRTHFPPKTSSAHQNDSLLSGPCTTVESFRRIRVEILLRSDLTRVPLGVWLPQMIYAHCSFQSALHSKCSFPEDADWLFVCALLMFVRLSVNSLGQLRFLAMYWFIRKRRSAGGC